MSLVLIVDADARGLSTALEDLARQQQLGMRFQACLNPEEMFREMKKQIPDLIVLHHNWTGIGISEIISRIVIEANSATRVVVFTGQNVKINELVECVRGGVADYWTKSTFTVELALRRINHYCASQAWTIENLKMSSGSLRQLLDRVESSTEQLHRFENEKDALKQRVESLESQERARLRDVLLGLIKIIVIGLVLVAAYVTIDQSTHLETWANLVFIFILAACFLLSEGRITSAWIRWTGGAAGVNSHVSDGEGNRKE